MAGTALSPLALQIVDRGVGNIRLYLIFSGVKLM